MTLFLGKPATLNEVLSIPIPYTEELEETPFDKFLKKVEKGTVRVSEEELQEHIKKYYTRKDNTENFWMYKIHPEPKEHFIQCKLKSLREPPREDELLRHCFGILQYSLQTIYEQDFMKIIPLSYWKEFINDFTKQMIEFIGNFDASVSSVEKYRKSEQRVYAIMGMFHFEYSFKTIWKIFTDTTLTDFQKLRSIRVFLKDWEVPSEFFQFEMQHWKYFFEIEDDYSFGRVKLDKLIQTIIYKYPLRSIPIKIQDTDYDFYSFFGWKPISVCNVDNCEVPLTKGFIEDFFHCDSHFEENIFWLRNEIPYKIYYESNVGNEELFLSHKNEKNIERGILNCPVKHIPFHDICRIHSFCKKQYGCNETWEFLLKISSSISMKELLEKCFNILGRLNRQYPSSEYHYSLQEKMEKNMLNRKKLHSCKDKILFPEFYFNDKETQALLTECWEKSFDFFVQKFLCFFMKKEYNEVFYMERIPTFIVPPFDLTLFIGKEDLYVTLEKKKTYLNYFNTRNLFLMEKEITTSIEPKNKELYIEQIDLYVSSLLKKN